MQGTHGTGKMAKKFPVRENAGNLEILPQTQGIWFAQVVNSLMLKVMDIAIFAAKSRSWIGLPSQFCVCNSYKLWKLAQGKFAVGQGKHREFENII